MAGARVGRSGKILMGPILAVNLVVCTIVVGVASWSVDKYIDGEQNHPHLGGNPSTIFLLVFGLIGGAIGACSVLTGAIHLRAWREDTLASAAASAFLAWAVTALALGFVCKQIILGGHRGKRLQTLEAFVAVSTVSQTLYLGILHAGVLRRNHSPPPPFGILPPSCHPPSRHHPPSSAGESVIGMGFGGVALEGTRQRSEMRWGHDLINCR